MILQTRNFPFVIGAGVTVMVFALIAGAAVTGVIPMTSKQASPPLQSTAAAAAARKARCSTCGFIAALEPVQAENGNLAGYRVTLQMDDGRERSLSLGSRPPYRVGARVRVVDGNRLERG